MGAVDGYVAGLRTSLRLNATAYGYSVMITASFGITQLEAKPATALRIVLFVVGATLTFATVEAAASKGFRVRERGERTEVVVLGTALNLVSVTSGVGAGYLVAKALTSWPAWLLTPAAATAVFLLVSGTEMALARRAEEGRKHDG